MKSLKIIGLFFGLWNTQLWAEAPKLYCQKGKMELVDSLVAEINKSLEKHVHGIISSPKIWVDSYGYNVIVCVTVNNDVNKDLN